MVVSRLCYKILVQVFSKLSILGSQWLGFNQNKYTIKRSYRKVKTVYEVFKKIFIIVGLF